jgi:hypothetical protein
MEHVLAMSRLATAPRTCVTRRDGAELNRGCLERDGMEGMGTKLPALCRMMSVTKITPTHIPAFSFRTAPFDATLLIGMMDETAFAGCSCVGGGHRPVVG